MPHPPPPHTCLLGALGNPRLPNDWARWRDRLDRPALHGTLLLWRRKQRAFRSTASGVDQLRGHEIEVQSVRRVLYCRRPIDWVLSLALPQGSGVCRVPNAKHDQPGGGRLLRASGCENKTCWRLWASDPAVSGTHCPREFVKQKNAKFGRT